jgi:hypothetical protein
MQAKGEETDDDKIPEKSTEPCYTGNLENCIELGMKAQDSSDPQKDFVAYRHYKIACDGGLPVGCHMQALKSYDDSLVEAKALWIKSCEGGYLHGCHLHGHVELKRGNIDRAIKIFKKACNDGYKSSCENLRTLKK